MAISREQQQAELFKVFTNPTRLKILQILKEAEGSMAVADIVEEVALCESAISHHIRELYKNGIIEWGTKGMYNHYTVNYNRLNEIQDILAEIASNPCWDEYTMGDHKNSLLQ